MSRPITSEEQRLIDSPPIQDSFPVVFANGARWDQVTGHCAHCDAEIDPDSLRGVVTWPLPSVADVQGMAWCEACRVWTPIRIRLRDDMSMDGPVPGVGKRPWGRWQSSRKSWWFWLKKVFAP